MPGLMYHLEGVKEPLKPPKSVESLPTAQVKENWTSDFGIQCSQFEPRHVPNHKILAAHSEHDLDSLKKLIET